jgi:hypothetical protein
MLKIVIEKTIKHDNLLLGEKKNLKITCQQCVFFFCTLCQRVKDCELYVGVWGELVINRAYVGTGKNQTKGKGKQNMK